MVRDRRVRMVRLPLRLGARSLPVALALALLPTLGLGCAETQSTDEPRMRVVKNTEPEPVKGGIPPDKQAENQLVLQQRDTSTLKCYQDVLNEKHTRTFKGTVFVMLTIEPSGQAS